MYADPSMRRRFRPVSFGAALAVNTAILGALMFAAPQVIKLPGDPPIKIIDVFTPEPPPPIDPPKDKVVEQVRESPIYQPTVITPTLITPNTITTTTEPPLNPPLPVVGTPEGTGEVVTPPPPPLPFLAAAIDPRFAGAFQPEYPASELRGQREGKVTVRVRIGTDGRVTAVEQVRATSPAFFDATRRHAISRWRFKPATRGGKPEESWKTMNVTFVLTDND